MPGNTPRSAPTKYDVCRSKKIDTVMKEYKKGELKSRSGTKVKKENQAIAIALSEANKVCKPKTKKSLEKVETKVTDFLYNDDRKISKERIPLSNVKQTIMIIERSNKKEADKLTKALYQRILSGIRSGVTVSDNVIDEVVKMGKRMKLNKE